MTGDKQTIRARAVARPVQGNTLVPERHHHDARLPVALPRAKNGCRAVEYADELGRLHIGSTDAAKRKYLGQYLTPIPVADFMASLVTSDKSALTILDPGAGTGVLSCALAESLAKGSHALEVIRIDAYEVDRQLTPLLEKSLAVLARKLKSFGTNIEFKVHAEDFILKNSTLRNGNGNLFVNGPSTQYDIVIANPPYFKLAKSDPRAQAALDVIHGQPNIYAVFMAVAASLLKPDGELIFITPRSFASGPYFDRFREWFFERMKPEHIHVFNSRKDAFERDDVLQENIILKARKSPHWESGSNHSKVAISSSAGIRDLLKSRTRGVGIEQVVLKGAKNLILRIPDSSIDDEVKKLVDSWPGSLHAYGLQISTGPVVPFRAVEFLAASNGTGGSVVPLLWMQHVRQMQATWPLDSLRKPQYIKSEASAKRLLVPNRNYVLLRRFSAKEEHRRLVAAPYLKSKVAFSVIGLENHLNYLYRVSGELTDDETFGLAALYNSSLLDLYFRSFNGNTQVSATELRSLPLPSLEVIKEIGRRLLDGEFEVSDVDEAINKVLQEFHLKTVNLRVYA